MSTYVHCCSLLPLGGLAPRALCYGSRWLQGAREPEGSHFNSLVSEGREDRTCYSQDGASKAFYGKQEAMILLLG